jgi:hypothetical protein
MLFELPKLPYKLNSLVPYISEETLIFIMVNTIRLMLIISTDLFREQNLKRLILRLLSKRQRVVFSIMQLRCGIIPFISKVSQQMAEDCLPVFYLMQLTDRLALLILLKNSSTKLQLLSSEPDGHGWLKKMTEPFRLCRNRTPETLFVKISNLLLPVMYGNMHTILIIETDVLIISNLSGK